MTPPADQSGRASDATRAQWVAFASMGLSAAVCVALGVVLGILADAWLGTSPILLFVGLVFGLVTATWLVIVRVRRFL